MDKKILVIEKLGIVEFLYYIIFSWKYSEAFYLSEVFYVSGKRKISMKMIRPLLSRIKKLRVLRDKDFPGAYYDVQKESVLNANERFYESIRSKTSFRDFLLKFKNNPLAEVSLKKGLFDYTSSRVRTYIFIKRILEKSDDSIEFIPVDNVDFSEYISKPLIPPSDKIYIPISIRFFYRLKQAFSGVNIILYSTAIIGFLFFSRGVVWRSPKPKNYPIGLFVFNEGIYWTRPYHDTFIYGEGIFNPKNILHVVADKLQDERTKKYYMDSGSQYVDSGKIKIPFSYFVKRVIYDFYFNVVSTVIRSKLSGPFNSIASNPAILTAYYIILNEILYLNYNIKLFIVRDEYVINHIARTIIANENGGKTLGFMHGDDNLLYFGNNYLCFDYYCIYGSFYKELQSRSLKHTKNIEIIGAGLVGLDQTYKYISEGRVTEKYKKIGEKYRIVTVFASTFDPDIYLTKELTLYFYKTVLSLLTTYDDIFIVIKPKHKDLLKAEIMQLIEESNRNRVVIENDIDTYGLIPIGDLMIVIGCCTVGIEGLMANKKVLYFDVSNYQEHPYRKYDEYLVALTEEEFYRNTERVLRDGKYISPQTLEHIRAMHGYKFDGHVVDRLREVALKAVGNDKIDDGK
jgi:hypothetical protein